MTGNGWLVCLATIVAATWFKSGLLVRLGMAQFCAASGRIQAESEISGFKLSQYRPGPFVDTGFRGC